ncbi:MAG: preprotein translocase subunit SecA, partial [Gillisia sp.]|nr:preprotein translocase subunit SecA [Gillisia sp.]
MSFLDSVFKVFIGDKSKKDVKEIQPIVDKILALEKTFEALTLDELREKTVSFKKKIADATLEMKEKIEALNKEADATDDITRNEDIYAEIDTLKEKIYVVSEGVLNEILPEAFATVKETARRFVNNKELKVKATAFDREISAENAYVRLEDDHAIWNNSWDAAGKPITWDMVHYEVQLIGGVAMHQGKIAEMQTGEGKT